mgnify:CR=1 FL=1
MEIATETASYLDTFGVPGVLILVVIWLIRERAKDQARHDAQRKILGDKLDANVANYIALAGKYEAKSEQSTAAVNRLADSMARNQAGN